MLNQAPAVRLDYDPRSPQVQADPYPYYRSLREFEPVSWNAPLGAWLVARYQDVLGMLRDPRWSSNYASGPSDPSHTESAQEAPGRILLFMDAPEHTELRKVVAKGFGGGLMGTLASVARAVAEELLAPLRERSECDLIADFATPLPIRVIARLLGVPDEGLALIAENANALATLVDWTPASETLDRAEGRALALSPYLMELVVQKRRAPGNDLLSTLVEHAKHRNIKYVDIVSTAILILAAGQVTSTHMIGNGVLALLRNPEVASQWRAGRYSTAQVVEEILRFDPPVQVTPRRALVDIDIAGTLIPRGSNALGLLGSANRDPAAYPDPETLDPGRRAGMSASFGAGAHFCIGAPLARVIGGAALDQLWQGWPAIRLAPQTLSWRPTITQRGLLGLRVAL